MTRWTPRRKLALVTDLRGGRLTMAEAERRYALSAEEIAAWERNLARHGTGGLRTTRTQIYRRKRI